MAKVKYFFITLIFFLSYGNTFAQANQFSVIAYYAGGPSQVDSFSIEELTEIIFSFSHLKGNQLHINNARDTATIRKLVALKNRNSKLKVILSLGGWGGCATCSDIFSSKKNRKAFARSVKRISEYFKTDGIDLDWEYPAIEGFPGHQYQRADKENFTHLINQLRKTLGKKYEISFAAGGFKEFIDESVEWRKVMKKVDRVNLMTYDLVSGFDTTTGHHTALYATPYQTESTNRSVTQLTNLGVPENKIVIGAAFYGRVWEGVADTGFGLYQTGKYRNNVSFKNIDEKLSADSGFVYHWDEVANAPYSYNPKQKLFATYDDKRSMELKAKYVVDKHLNGIMFWQLADDSFRNGLLQVIDDVKSDYIGKIN